MSKNKKRNHKFLPGEGIVRMGGRHISFTRVVRVNKDVTAVLLRNGWIIQAPKQNIVRLPSTQ